MASVMLRIIQQGLTGPTIVTYRYSRSGFIWFLHNALLELQHAVSESIFWQV
jgi:hypothetical protein